MYISKSENICDRRYLSCSANNTLNFLLCKSLWYKTWLSFIKRAQKAKYYRFFCVCVCVCVFFLAICENVDIATLILTIYQNMLDNVIGLDSMSISLPDTSIISISCLFSSIDNSYQ